MLHLKQCVIVEGKYDKQRLKQLVDATIIETNGFRIFRDREKRLLIRTLAEKNGLIVLTDSDSAGFLIRRHLKGLVPADRITHVYIPEILGKEARKAAPSKEGLIGVEGMENEILLNAFQNAGVLSTDQPPALKQKITKTDLYEAGLSGCENSSVRRQKLLKQLCLPHYITTNALLEILNTAVGYEQFLELVSALDNDR